MTSTVSSASSGQNVSLAEHLALRISEGVPIETRPTARKAPRRLVAVELAMKPPPAKNQVKTEALSGPESLTGPESLIEIEHLTQSESRTEPQYRPMNELIDALSRPMKDQTEALSQALESSPRPRIHDGTKPHWGRAQKPRLVSPAHRRHPVLASTLKFNPCPNKIRSRTVSRVVERSQVATLAQPLKQQNPVSLSDLHLNPRPLDNHTTPGSQSTHEPQPQLELEDFFTRPTKRQNPVSLSDLYLNPRPAGNQATPGPQSVLEHQLLSEVQNITTQPTRWQNPILVEDLKLKPRPVANQMTPGLQPACETRSAFESQNIVTQPARQQTSILLEDLELRSRHKEKTVLESQNFLEAQPMFDFEAEAGPEVAPAPRKQKNRILPANLTFKPRPDNHQVEMPEARSEVCDCELLEGTTLAASLSDCASTPGGPTPTSSIDGDHPDFPPGLTSSLQGIVFHPATISSEDLVSSPPTTSSTTSSCLQLTPPASPTIEMAPPKKASQVAKAASSNDTPNKATLQATPEVNPKATSTMVCSFHLAPVAPAPIAQIRSTTDIKVHLMMASFGYQRADSSDMELMTVLKQIEIRHGVKIDVDSNKNRLIIHAQSKKQVAETIQAVKKAMWLEQAPQSSKIWCPSIFLAPTKIRKADFKAFLDICSRNGARPCLAPDRGPAALPHEYNKLLAKWEDDFRSKMFEAAKAMRSRPLQMSMRVHLGIVRLQEWKKNKPIYTYDELQAELYRRGNRGTFIFDWMLGGDGFAFRILEKIYNSPDWFEPHDTRFGYIQEVKPKHTLMLQTINLKIEMDVISVKGTDVSDKVLRLGPARGYRRETRSEAIEITTAFPELSYDWNLAVETRVPVNTLPFTHQDISKSSGITAREDPQEFPEVYLMQDFAETHKVEEMKGRTSWTFKLKDSSYAIEVSVYHLLAANTNKKIPSGCGVNIFRPAWDTELGVHNLADGPRQWTEQNFHELFPILSLKEKDGITAFLRAIGEVHNFISNMAAQDSPGKAVIEGPVAGEEDLLMFEEEVKKAEQAKIKKESEESDLLILDTEIKQEDAEDDAKVAPTAPVVEEPVIRKEDLLMFEEELNKKELVKQGTEKKSASSESSSSKASYSGDAVKKEAVPGEAPSSGASGKKKAGEDLLIDFD